MSDDKQAFAPRPNTDLDFQQQLTDPFISSQYVEVDFTNKFKEFVYILDAAGNPVLDDGGKPKIALRRDLWAVLSLFTRDWRLGNIDKSEESVYIRYHLDLASDILVLLGDDFREPALICIERGLCVNETSQSKGGFLRKLLNTFIHKTTPNAETETKRGLFGLGKKKGGF